MRLIYTADVTLAMSYKKEIEASLGLTHGKCILAEVDRTPAAAVVDEPFRVSHTVTGNCNSSPATPSVGTELCGIDLWSRSSIFGTVMPVGEHGPC